MLQRQRAPTRGTPARWGAALALFVCLILLGTTYPFDFSADCARKRLSLSLPYLVLGISSGADFINNCLLYIPLGFCAAGFVVRELDNRITAWSGVLALSLGLSFFSELAQLFLPSRFPSGVDILGNLVGALIGTAVLQIWQAGNATLSLASLSVAVLCISYQLQLTSQLKDWDPDFPLIIGNEHTGDRPWKGTLHSLRVANQAVPAERIGWLAGCHPNQVGCDSLIASFDFAGQAPLVDLIGNLPPFRWRGVADHLSVAGVSVGPGRWLETSGRGLTQRISETGQFTLLVTAVSHDPHQTGPARIVSLSVNPERRNLTLAQEGSDLAFRFRTPITGANGSRPEARIPGVFAQNRPRQVAVSYNGAELEFCVDGVRQPGSLQFSPGVALVQHFVSPSLLSQWLEPAKWTNLFTVLYYAAAFSSLGILWTALAARREWALEWQGFLVVFGVGAFSLVFDQLLATTSHRTVNEGNVLLGWISGASAAVLYRAWVRYIS